ncbi:U8 snoRNA-decapping enzyme-like [Oppia nitens]|uniref:U8 snoRNA-decapping enzyme-like n=1 Tax=Oppia nitens TaxID=1686743 RepID=UPI0023DAF193|nr:U8 snoRNA-decapping enzyme-like [Oppia nitens]
MTGMFDPIELDVSLDVYGGSYAHTVHAFLWSRNPSTGIAYALMQLKSTGRFGFPGGRTEQSPVDGQVVIETLYREVWEEMHYQLADGQITIADHLCSHVVHSKHGKCYHFFAKQLAYEDFLVAETSYTSAESFPDELVGVIRVPLGRTDDDRCKEVRLFFDGFVEQYFSGNTRNQLLVSLRKLKVMSDEDLNINFNFT